MLDGDTCYRALTARDPRFDGVFFVAVSTTGVYCRPVCPARTPARARCSFFPSAAAAEVAGFRACFRCRPELAPGLGPIDGAARLADGAARLIETGYLDEHSADELAAELGVTSRHLRRTLARELGASPVGLAQSRRLALAKRLLQDSSLSIADVAYASGYSSLRRFNAAFRGRFDRPPSDVRRGRQAGVSDEGSFGLRLDFRPPLDWPALLGFLAPRAIPGVEQVREGRYRRTVRLDDATGWLEVFRDEACLRVRVSLSLARVVARVVRGLRDLFDLDAHVATIGEHLGCDPLLAPSVRARPGLRVPGAFDRFETAARALLGQQISVKGATTLSGRLVTRLGADVETPFDGLDRLFPSPSEVRDVSGIAALGMPRARAAALVGLARHAEQGGLSPSDDMGERVAALSAIAGIGDWTASYVAMRALRWPDGFPSSDLVLRKRLGMTASEVYRRAEPWRPWRGYAAMHIWTEAL